MKYISLLRGINVSGQKKIKMLDLKSLYESLGFVNVVTYIQSGNVIFESDNKNIAKLKSQIEDTIEGKFKFDVPVEIRKKSEVTTIITNNPLGPINLETDSTRVLVTFLAAKPNKDKLADLLSYVSLPNKMLISGKEIYLYCPNGYGKSKLTNNFIEKKLGVVATTRNWKSVLKLHELSS